MNKWDHLLSIALLGFLFVSQVYSADRGSKPIRLNGIEIDIPTLAETQPFHPQSVENASLCHVLIQFRQPTSPREREKIEQTGICFLHYVPNNTYFISGPVDALNALRRDTRVVGVIPIPSEAKIDTGIRERIGEGEAPAERQVSGKRPSSPPKIGGDTEGVDITQPESQATETVKVLFYPETSFNDSRRTLLAHSAILEATRTGFDFRQTFNSVTLPVDQIRSLAEEDSVFLITEIDPPAKPANLDAQDTSNVDEIQPGGIAGYNLDGTGVTVGMWDSGFIRFTHEQVIGRATQEDWNSAPYFNAHSCHVAGIIAGNGKGNAQAEGMAPNATLLCWETTNDLNEIDTNAHRISVSNHSYVSGISPVQTGNTGRTVATSNYNGVYSSQTQAFDRLAADHNLIMVMAAGNARKTSGIDGYDSLPSGTAKNVITVGAIHDRIEEPPIPDDSSMTDFSSWGPTDDGRIKPDVVANGLGLLSMGPNSDNDYYTNSGTSMSTPVVSGIAACLVQQYRRYFAGNDPEAATMKSILIHTARDGGSERGPDYRFGWGLVDARAAADFIANQGIGGSQIILDSYTDSFLEYPMTYMGTGPIKATLAWTDPPGIPVSSYEEDNTPNLVNDLDLHVFGPDGAHYTWTLDPTNPSFPARQDCENHRDNVEQILIESPAPGLYTICIDGQVNLGDSQEFALCISGLRPVAEAPHIIHAKVLSPSNREVVSGEIEIHARILDNLAASRIAVKVDGVVIDDADIGGIEGEIDIIPPQRETTQTVPWDTTTVANGIHVIEVTAVSTDGLTFTRDHEVFVCNDNTRILALALDGPPAFERISPSGDEDWYSFYVPVSATCTVEILRPWDLKSDLDSVIALYESADLNQPIFANDDGVDGNLSRITQVLEGDRTYFVKVTGYPRSTGYYRIQFRSTPGNEPVPIVPLDVNGSLVSSASVGSTSEQLYTFRTTAFGIHSFGMLTANGVPSVSRDIRLYKAGDEKTLVASATPGVFLNKVLPENGVYLLRVVPKNGLADPYSIGVSTKAGGPCVALTLNASPRPGQFSSDAVTERWYSLDTSNARLYGLAELDSVSGRFSNGPKITLCGPDNPEKEHVSGFPRPPYPDSSRVLALLLPHYRYFLRVDSLDWAGSYQIRVRQVNPGEYLPLERSFTPKKYRPGERISVTLQSARYADTAVNTSFNYVYEIIPPGWAAENISHGGMFLRRAIFWRLASPDSSLRQVCYDLVAPSDGSGTCEFRESFYVLFVDGIPVDALSIAGETSLMENTDTGVENWSRHAE